jgi:hypothetical protein
MCACSYQPKHDVDVILKVSAIVCVGIIRFEDIHFSFFKQDSRAARKQQDPKVVATNLVLAYPPIPMCLLVLTYSHEVIAYESKLINFEQASRGGKMEDIACISAAG